MSVLNAIRNGVSGLGAQATKLAGISNNIANSSTVGYKEVDTSFESLVLEGAGSGSFAQAGVMAHNRLAISKAGQVQRTGNDTDIAVNGAGFLVVNDAPDSTGPYLATRAGSFRPDKEGNLANAAGYYLQGVALGPDGLPLNDLGNDNLSSLETVNVNRIAVASSPTTEMTFWANVPSELTGYASPPPDPIATSMGYFDPLGGPQTMRFEFTPTMPAAPGDPPTNSWTLRVFDSASATPAVPVGEAGLLFNAAGPFAGTIDAVTPVTGAYDPVFGTLTVPTGRGGPLPIRIGVADSFEGMTQLNGDYVTTRMDKNGSTFGTLDRVAVDKDGKVLATFSNGATRAIYQLRLALPPNPDGMNAVQGDAFEFSPEAGVPRLLAPGEGAAGTTSGAALEASNVDISEQLTSLIETQRAYSSNASVIRTADEMLDEATRLKR